MNSIRTRGIVLKRTDYGEADRIVTMLTPDQGKLRLMARGVRKPKAKLAGGIELFSVSDLSFIRGRGEIGTLISARLDRHYGKIVNDIDRVQLGYELMKLLDKATEDEPEEAYFYLMEQALRALDDEKISLDLVRAWFGAHMLRLAGHAPNLKTTAAGGALSESDRYVFDFDHMAFEPKPSGRFGPADIKFLRLLFSGHAPAALSRVDSLDGLLARCAPLLAASLKNHMHV
ncbi:MAG TPA: DNA repair protein RecO [Candidatus Saccharimonadales bacterium]|nr:DNA repair protein RecO [Candidatus Saccharimonadales bacterium]